MPAPKRRRSSTSSDSASGSEDASGAPQGSRTDAITGPDWPAPADAMTAARAFLRDCAAHSRLTLLVPDKDADGLSAGVIVHRLLVALGHDPARIRVHLMSKGSNPHADAERAAMAEYGAEYAVVLDQGSRGGPALVPPKEEGGEKVKTLLVDHHLSTEFPEDTLVLSACATPPIATSAALTYALCAPLHTRVAATCDYLCAMGTHGDLGTSFKWEPPWPDMRACFKAHTKSAINGAVSLVNAPRRTATFDVRSAWEALLASPSPAALLAHPRLLAARAEVNAEVSRCARSAPAFSADGRVALVRLHSGAQVHPVIATRWAGSLKGARLELVVAANDGYLPGMTNFAVRVAKVALARAKTTVPSTPAPAFKKFKRAADTPAPAPAPAPEADAGATDDDAGISIPARLEAYAARVPGLRAALGGDFARGHAHASGGIVRSELFERLWAAIAEGDGEGGAEGVKAKKGSPKKAQKNTLEGWVKKA